MIKEVSQAIRQTVRIWQKETYRLKDVRFIQQQRTNRATGMSGS